MQPYEITEHTADIGLLIYGKTLPELFTNAVLGLFHIISPNLSVCKKEDVFPSVKHLDIIELPAPAEEELLIYWLNEYIYRFFVENKYPENITIDLLENGNIRARVDFKKRPKDMEIQKEIKAATYHKLSIKKITGTWQAHVIFDI